MLPNSLLLLQLIQDLHFQHFLRELGDAMLCGVFEGEAVCMIDKGFIIAREREGRKVALEESAAGGSEEGSGCGAVGDFEGEVWVIFEGQLRELQ